MHRGKPPGSGPLQRPVRFHLAHAGLGRTLVGHMSELASRTLLALLEGVGENHRVRMSRQHLVQRTLVSLYRQTAAMRELIDQLGFVVCEEKGNGGHGDSLYRLLVTRRKGPGLRLAYLPDAEPPEVPWAETRYRATITLDVPANSQADAATRVRTVLGLVRPQLQGARLLKLEQLGVDVESTLA